MVHLPEPKVIRSFRNSISLQVTREGEILVKAPYFAPNSAINHFLLEKEQWILNSLQKIGNKKSRTKHYTQGELFYFLGEKHALTFYSGIEIKAEKGKIFFPKALTFRIQKELPNWFVQKAKEKIMERLAFHSKQMQTTYGEVLFSDTKSKWGTCFADNSLQFSWRLIMAPLLVLDYVVIHELAHTTEKNHSSDFWRRVGRFTPAYRQHRKWLNEHGNKLVV